LHSPLIGEVLVDVALEGTDDLLLEHSRSGIAEDTDAELEAVIAPALSVNENFHVTCFAISGNNRSNGEIRGRFARGFRSDLRHRTYRKTIFNHDEDRYMRSAIARSRAPKEFTRTLHAPTRARAYECDDAASQEPLRNNVIATSTLLHNASRIAGHDLSQRMSVFHE
jgi:hypothetical protein